MATVEQTKAFIFHGVAEPAGSLVPRMVILVAPTSIVAYGDRSTFSGREADSITARYAGVEPTQIPNLLAQFEDVYAPGSMPYGGKIEVTDYKGQNKARVDTLITKFRNQAGLIAPTQASKES